MNLLDFLLETIQLLVYIPAAVICYLPMKNQLKYSGIKIFLSVALVFGIFIPFGTWLYTICEMELNTIIFSTMAIFFIMYQYTLKTDFFQSLSVFLFSCVLSAFTANFAYTFDAWLNPDGISSQPSWQAGLFQLVTTCIMMILFAYPLRRWGSRLIDNIKIPNVWILILSISVVFLTLSVAIIPHNYSTLHIGRCFPIYITILIVMLILLLLLYTGIYIISMSVLSTAELTERIHFFEMQETQYLMQKKYIEETSKQRHDFRQSLFTLNKLAEDGNLEGLKEYLVKYVQTLPKTEIKPYCKNSAVNALLNYYAQSAKDNGIRIDWNINLPDHLTISEPDFCSLLGNLIENAISGCMTVSDKKHCYHCLSITLKNKVNLYIVSTNSFNGIVKIKDEQYLSTKRRGNGIGIHSMKMVAEKYDGIARFYHSEYEFYADIMLIVPKETLKYLP